MANTHTSSVALRAFEKPQTFRDAFLSAKLIEGDQKNFTGKSFVCVSLTRFCPVGCKFCFFKSGPVFKQASHEDHFTPQGMDRFVTFCNNIDLGYLLVSGGGEPMMERKSVLRIIADVVSERIVLVTSAHWAKTPESAARYLDEIVAALGARKVPTSVTVRVSVDAEHAANLTLAPIKNLITLFAQKYGTHPQLDLQIHSIDHDPSIDTVVSELSQFRTTRTHVEQERISDGKNALKIVPRQEIITFDDLCVKIGYAKIFFSDLRVNLNNHDIIERNIAVYQKDLYESEDGNSSIVTNKLGNPGLDYWVNYNGNVTTWGNQFLDNLFNLYEDETQDVISGSLSDPAALSFIEKGAPYRDRIVGEVNPIAVGRSKAVNIRDYTGALMFDEARTRLYYTVRSLQDYVAWGRIEEARVKALPQDLQDLLATSPEELVAAYNASDAYTIVEQVAEGQDQDPAYVLDMLEWISLGHYQLSQDKIAKLMAHYNTLVAPEARITSLDQVVNTSKKMQIVRMTEHLTHIKPSMAVANIAPHMQEAA